MNISHPIFELDSLATVQSVNARKTDGSLGHIFSRILSTLPSFSSWTLHHLEREHDRVAHDLAQLAKFAAVGVFTKLH